MRLDRIGVTDLLTRESEMDELRKVVVGLAVLPPAELRKTRAIVEGISGNHHAKELVLNLIDMYLSIGEDTERRAEAAARCLVALDEMEKRVGSSAGTSKSKAGCTGMLLMLVGLSGLLYFLC